MKEIHTTKKIITIPLIEQITGAVYRYEKVLMPSHSREQISVYLPRYLRQTLIEELRELAYSGKTFSHDPTSETLRIRGIKVVDGYQDKIVVSHYDDVFYSPDRIVSIEIN
jgi:hypothetical protein